MANFNDFPKGRNPYFDFRDPSYDRTKNLFSMFVRSRVSQDREENRFTSVAIDNLPRGVAMVIPFEHLSQIDNFFSVPISVTLEDINTEKMDFGDIVNVVREWCELSWEMKSFIMSLSIHGRLPVFASVNAVSGAGIHGQGQNLLGCALVECGND